MFCPMKLLGSAWSSRGSIAFASVLFGAAATVGGNGVAVGGTGVAVGGTGVAVAAAASLANGAVDVAVVVTA